MKIAVAQIACVLGEIAGNLAHIRRFNSRAAEAGAELVVFPEMADTGYAKRVIGQCAQPWRGGGAGTTVELTRLGRAAVDAYTDAMRSGLGGL